MDKLTIYLCGAINGCSDAEAKDWRNYVKETYADRYDYLDPMDRDFRGRENEPGIDAEIVEGDVADITHSDVILVNYDKPSVGTSMEIYLARQAGKFVIIVAKPGEKLSPWLTYHAHAIVHSFAEAMDRIAKVEQAGVYQERYMNDLFTEMERIWEEIFPGARFDSRV